MNCGRFRFFFAFLLGIDAFLETERTVIPTLECRQALAGICVKGFAVFEAFLLGGCCIEYEVLP